MNNWFSLLLLALVFIFGFGFIAISIASASMAPWVPSKRRDVLRGLKIARPKEGEIIYDLGCGTGTVIFLAAKNYPVIARGVEMAYPLYLICKVRSFFSGGVKNRVKFLNKNLFKTDTSEADIVYVFGMPKALSNRLRPKLEKELKPGARIISYVFNIDGWEPTIIDRPEGENPIYLYIKK